MAPDCISHWATWAGLTLVVGSQNRLALCGTDGQLFTTDVSAKFKVTWRKLGQISKIRPDHIYIFCTSLRISGQLSVPIVNGEVDSIWKWKDFQLWKARDLYLDLGLDHTAYRRASLIDLYVHAKFHWYRRNFLWTDGHMYVQTDGHLRPTLFIWLRRVDLHRPRQSSTEKYLANETWFALYINFYFTCPTVLLFTTR